MADDGGYNARMQARAGYLTTGNKGLVAINGGGAVALLALLQAVWSRAPALVPWLLGALFALAVGVALSAYLPFLDHKIAILYERAATESPADEAHSDIVTREAWRNRIIGLALALFVLAIGLTIVGVLRTPTPK